MFTFKQIMEEICQEDSRTMVLVRQTMDLVSTQCMGLVTRQCSMALAAMALVATGQTCTMDLVLVHTQHRSAALFIVDCLISESLSCVIF